MDGIDVQVAEYAYFKHLITNSGSDVVRIFLIVMNERRRECDGDKEIATKAGKNEILSKIFHLIERKKILNYFPFTLSNTVLLFDKQFPCKQTPSDISLQNHTWVV